MPTGQAAWLVRARRRALLRRLERDPHRQIAAIQTRLGTSDALNEYVVRTRGRRGERYAGELVRLSARA